MVLAGMELGAHHVVIVAGEDGDAGPGLPVPDADGLVVGGAQNPGIFMVEGCGSDVVQVAEEGEDAPTLLEVPHLDLEVIATGDEKRLLAVETDSSYRSIVFVELL